MKSSIATVVGFALFALVCIAQLSASAPVASLLGRQKVPSEGETGNEFDFFMLVFQWAPAVCATSGTAHTCVIPSQVRYWTLHGLWPSRNDTTYPSFCCSTCTFNDSAIYDLTTSLNNYWPNLFTDEAADSFYSHEYLKHGVCATAIPAVNNEHDYFAATLALYPSYNVAKALSSGGIIPSSSKGYPLSSIVSASKAYLGFSPYLTCSSHNSEQVITGFGLCLDKTTFAPFECASTVLGENTCKSTSNIYLLPF